MALRQSGILLAVAARSRWSRLRREAGYGGPASSAFAAVIIVLTLVLPGHMVYQISSTIYQELRATGDPDVLARWNGLKALFTLGFAAFAVFRYRPTFQFSDVGRLPVTPASLLIAEIPATLFEVFPLLGCLGVFASSVAVVTTSPSMFPIASLVTVIEIVLFLTIVYAGFALKTMLFRRRYAFYMIGISGVSMMFWAGFDRIRMWIREGLPVIVSWSPASIGWESGFAMTEGLELRALMRLGGATIVTLAAFVVVSGFHYRSFRSGFGFVNEAGRRSERPHFGHPILAVGRLFRRQVLDTRLGKVLLFLPSFYTAPLAIVIWFIGKASADNRVLPPEIVGTVEFVTTLPLVAIVLVLVIICDSSIWMNQFGWERGGVRTFFHHPITTRAILLGHLAGIAVFMAAQSVIGLVPLFTFYRPSFLEVVAAVGGAASFALLAIGTGHYFSGRFPRAVAREGNSAVPLYLSWVPMVVIGGSLMFFFPIFKASRRFGWGIPAIIVVVVAVVAIGVYMAVVPVLADELEKNRERVIGM